MARYRLSAAAQADIIHVLTWTHEHFGEAARKRYEVLIVAALRDVSNSPAGFRARVRRRRSP
ncbi:MAG: type II toxin-antitoxin system RelE/ParE family toxin [Burkholderiales bacterium]|jgi:toxin ParE1/3/4|nr:type II toxin-antitoxin system RelE/ParE family toxin [Burkholderiales bacterium]